MELDVIIERNDIVQGHLAEGQDESPANWEKNEYDIGMEDECSWASRGYFDLTEDATKGRTKADTDDSAGVSEGIIGLLEQEVEDND